MINRYDCWHPEHSRDRVAYRRHAHQNATNRTVVREAIKKNHARGGKWQLRVQPAIPDPPISFKLSPKNQENLAAIIGKYLS